MSIDRVIDLCNNHEITFCTVKKVLNDVNPADVSVVTNAIHHQKENDSPKDFLATINASLSVSNETQSYLLLKMLVLFGLLPISYLSHGHIRRNSPSSRFLQWLYPTLNGIADEECHLPNKKFLELHQSLSNSGMNCFNLKGLTLSMLDTILSTLDSIIDKQNPSCDYFKEGSLVLNSDFEGYISQLQKTQKIYFFKRHGKPCNLFYILNGRLILRDSLSRKKVYVQVNYDANGCAEVVGLDKKGKGNNMKFVNVFYNTNVKK